MTTKRISWKRWKITDEGFAEYFWSRVAITKDKSECWEWQGTIEILGYGVIQVSGKYYKAHRLAWQLFHQRIPVLLILHSCDNKKCVNPNHLREGTQQDNMDDMVRRGRSHAPRNKGVVTAEIVKEIKRLRREKVFIDTIAEQLNIGRSLVGHISAGNTWKHVNIDG